MRRYRGEALPDRPRIAVVSNDAIGNYLVVTPLLQMLRDAHRPSHLAYFSGPRTEELWSREPLIDCGVSMFGIEPRDLLTQIAAEPPFSLVINVEGAAFPKTVAALLAGPDGLVCGPSLGMEGRYDLPFADDLRGTLAGDEEWVAEDLTQRYPFLTTGFIGEIFCRLAYLEGPIPAYRVPSETPDQQDLPDVYIAMSASLKEKLWPLDSWRSVLRGLDGTRIGLLGARPTDQRRFWLGSADEQALVDEHLVEDWRGAFTLPQVVGALRKAKAVLTLDNGILHLATAADVPTVGLFRDKIHRLWAPPAPKLTVLTPGADEGVAAIETERVAKEVAAALE